MITGVFILESVTRLQCSKQVAWHYDTCEGLRIKAFAKPGQDLGLTSSSGHIEAIIVGQEAMAALMATPIGAELLVQISLAEPSTGQQEAEQEGDLPPLTYEDLPDCKP